jgi:hypothetical protein
MMENPGRPARFSHYESSGQAARAAMNPTRGTAPIIAAEVAIVFAVALLIRPVGNGGLGNSLGSPTTYSLINPKSGFIDRTGRVVIKPVFDWAGPFSEGLATVRIGKRHGYINKKGALVIKPLFDEAKEFREGLAPVEVKGKFGYIDTAGNRIGSLSSTPYCLLLTAFCLLPSRVLLRPSSLPRVRGGG